MKRIIFITLLFLIFSIQNTNASSVNYNLKINQNKHFYETITYSIEDNNTSDFNRIINSDVFFDKNNTEKYTKTIKHINSNYIVVLKYDYDYSNLNKSQLLNRCFDEIDYETDQNQLVFSTYGDFKCNVADSIRVTINSDIVMTTNNADEINNNNYVWNVENNFLYIGVRIGEESPDSNILGPYENTIITGDSIGDTYTGIKEHNSGLIIGAIGLGLVIVILYFYISRKKKNKFNDFEY